MANYDSTHTGAQIDEGVDIALSFNHSPIEIDTAVDIVDNITSSPASIDNAVDYVSDLEGVGIDASSIASGLGFIGRFTNTPEDIDATVDKFETVNSQPSQIDDTVDLIVNNSASNYDLLVADGQGSCSWGSVSSLIPHIYQNFSTLTRANNGYERIEIKWTKISSGNTLSIFKTYLHHFSSLNAVLPATGVIDNNGSEFKVDGIYYDITTQTFHAINNTGLILNDIVINIDSFIYNVYQLPLWL